MLHWIRKLLGIETPLLSASDRRWLAREIARGNIKVSR